jgi:adenylate kinase
VVAPLCVIDSLKTDETAAEVVPGPILLLGAPGSGKGTQAKNIMAAWGVPQISTGDLLRENKARGTPLGLQASQLMGQGKLVPDDLVNEMVAVRLAEPDTRRGYILDGYPRTLGQAEWLDQRLGSHGAGAAAGFPVIAVSLRVSYNQLLCRITGRRNCPTCQRIYNVYLQPPKVDTVCDVEGTPLVARADDVEAVFEERMRVYEALTAPVVDHYRAKGRFIEVDGEQAVDDVTAAITAAVVRLRTQA